VKPPLWPDEFDIPALKRAGYTLQEVREFDRQWQASIPLHVRKASEARMSALFDAVDAALAELGRALGVGQDAPDKGDDGRLGVE
jgi:hypothetical protein